MLDLTHYSSKSVRQLLNGNPTIAKMLTINTDDEIKTYLVSTYKMTEEQINYFIDNI